MRIPESPKPFIEIMRGTHSPQSIANAISAIAAGDASDARYLHWDELRSRKPPAGLTHDEWWAAIKISRITMSRRLDLVEYSTGLHFPYGLPDKLLQENEFVAKNTAGHISFGEEIINSATRDRYLVNSLMEEAITSSQLEGASTEKVVAKEMIRSGRDPRDRSERMVINNFRAMEFIGEHRNERLTPELICEVQRIVTEGTLDNQAAAGRFQQPGEERVKVWDNYGNVIYQPPPAEMIAVRIEDLCRFANAAQTKSYLPGVLKAIALHFMIGYEHPFEDGNGRTARLIFYWSMLNQGYWLTEYISVSRILHAAPAKYARSFLYTETDEYDLTYFFIYHLSVLHRAIDELHAYLARKMEEVRDLRDRLRHDSAQFNSRQLALLHHALKKPSATYSVQSHLVSHGVSAETARKDLVQLEASGLLDRRQLGKKSVYKPASDIAERIKQLGG